MDVCILITYQGCSFIFDCIIVYQKQEITLIKRMKIPEKIAEYLDLRYLELQVTLTSLLLNSQADRFSVNIELVCGRLLPLVNRREKRCLYSAAGQPEHGQVRPLTGTET